MNTPVRTPIEIVVMSAKKYGELPFVSVTLGYVDQNGYTVEVRLCGHWTVVGHALFTAIVLRCDPTPCVQCAKRA